MRRFVAHGDVPIASDLQARASKICKAGKDYFSKVSHTSEGIPYPSQQDRACRRLAKFTCIVCNFFLRRLRKLLADGLKKWD
jgi:hypothetical protein